MLDKPPTACKWCGSDEHVIMEICDSCYVRLGGTKREKQERGKLKGAKYSNVSASRLKRAWN